MKVPKYITDAHKAYMKRKRKEGWKHYATIAPPKIVERLKELRKELMAELKEE